ncbi:unnamed protein product [Chondrus crispus]|uniref:Tc1-like transposase DDE domain-containing protein n=1 Tax=Chondrus crispus TaxID=2769 RepID=R7QN45_CHOCR|nr:unnamed protein product [Chondrus crispus]CDF39203.1 unnamed protein product [Chondrus crispus]|eukprot:XP_005719114.1 unnamed protein product [Chondrus crispus]
MRERHEKQPLTWSMEKMTWTRSQWEWIVWFDEKKFNLDGRDGLAYKWHDLRRKKQWFSKRHSGGGIVMVWGCFAAQRTSSLVILSGTQNGIKYVDRLREHFLPFAHDHPLNWTFMPDGAPCHRSSVAKAWLRDNFINVLDWPAYSPDLNPIENLWGILVRKVYANQRQFGDSNSLVDCIVAAWNNLSTETLENLVNSTQNRCIDVVQARGKKIDY